MMSERYLMFLQFILGLFFVVFFFGDYDVKTEFDDFDVYFYESIARRHT